MIPLISVGRSARRAWRIAGAALLISGLAPLPASAGPQISIQKMREELGTLTAGESAEAEFPLANRGTEPLKIERVGVSCGCVTTSYPVTLAPGEKGLLKVKLVSNPLWEGPIEKQVTVVSNDPEQRALRLQLAAHVRPLLRFSPGNPLSVSYTRGEVIRQVFTVTSAADPPIRVTGVVPGGAETQVRLLPAGSTGPPGVWRIEMTARPPERGGDLSCHAILRTTHPRVPEVRLLLNVISRDALVALPPVVYLHGLGTGPADGSPSIVGLFKREGTFRVLRVETDTPVLQATVQQPGPSAASGASTGRRKYSAGRGMG